MKRKTTIRIQYDDGQTAEAIVTTNNKKARLARFEAAAQHDHAVDAVVQALRNIPYAPAAPLRAVRLRP